MGAVMKTELVTKVFVKTRVGEKERRQNFGQSSA